MMYIDLMDLKVVKDFKIKRIININDVLRGDVRTQEGDILTGNLVSKDMEEKIIGLNFSEYVTLLKKKNNGLSSFSPASESFSDRVMTHDMHNVAAVALEIGNSYWLRMNDINVAGTLNLKGNYSQGVHIRGLNANNVHIGNNSFGMDKNVFSLIGGGNGLHLENATINESLLINGPVVKDTVRIWDVKVGKYTYIHFDDQYGAEKSVDIRGTFEGPAKLYGRIRGNLDLSRSKFGDKFTIGNLIVEGDINLTDVEGLSGDNLELKGPVEVKGQYTGPANMKQYFTN